MASVAPDVVVSGTVVSGTVVSGTVVAAPPGRRRRRHGRRRGVVVGTVVGHPALLALPPGVNYVQEGTGKNKWELQTAPLLPTDAVVDVFALDRSLFDAANAAKSRVHVCNGAPGTLDVELHGESFCLPNFCLQVPPFVLPWTGHFVLFCPIVLAPQICNLVCFRHKNMDFPPWADHALIVTEKGVVGRRAMRPDRDRGSEWNHYERDVNAIAWSGFDVDEIEVRRYAEDKTCYWNCDGPPGHPDPLSYALGFGFLGPCCWKVLCNPTTPGLYRVRIKSDHTTTEGESRFETANIDVIALARSPEDLLESLRAAKAKYEAPAAAAMDRSHAPPART